MQKVVMLCLLSTGICFAMQKPVILWDLHEVIFNQQNPISVIIHYPYLYQAITQISWSLFKDLLYELIANIFDQKSTEDYLNIIRKHNNPYLEDLIIRVANRLNVIPTMDQLVYELTALGYPQHIGSNIGPLAFKKLIDPQNYPDFVSIFNQFDIPASQVAQWQDGILIRKPDPQYFQLYLNKNNLNPYEKHIIFIDDNIHNIRAAQKLGFDTILFKHPYQLRTELRKRGIPVAPPPYTIVSQNSSHALYNPRLYIKPQSN
jgi:FMN phosphatase YigB (HAD superfamily)